MNKKKSRYKILISATSKKEAQKILKNLLEKRLVAGGLIWKGKAIYYLKDKIKKKKFFPIFSYTLDDNKEKIIEIVKNITKDIAPCISFFEINHTNEEFANWIDENVYIH
ncbi:MAG: hypothetical protein K1000chlam1_00565 [Candidatus Anoxychlamydiales bacterium]|nr:hypothetical protein [Candidatus Anoxychlamydiales bacterium]